MPQDSSLLQGCQLRFGEIPGVLAVRAAEGRLLGGEEAHLDLNAIDFRAISGVGGLTSVVWKSVAILGDFQALPGAWEPD